MRSKLISCLAMLCSVVSAQNLISLTPISSTSPVPLTPLYFRASGLTPGAPVTVRFSGGGGFNVSVTPVRISSDGTVVVPVPLYFDGNGVIGPGSVTMVLSQNNRNSGSIMVNIQDLPARTTYGVKAGEISKAFLRLNALLAARRLNQFQALSKTPENKIDSARAQAELKATLSATMRAENEVGLIMKDESIAILGGVLANGASAAFDAQSLDLMDRIIAVLLSQTFSELGEFSALTAADHGKPLGLRSARQPVVQVIQVAGDLVEFLGIINSIGTFADCTTDVNCPARKLVDEGLSVVGGTAGLLASNEFLSKANNNFANRQLGAVGALFSTAQVVGNSFGDLAAFSRALATGDQNLMVEVVNEVNNNKGAMWKAVIDLTINSPLLQGFKTFGTVSSALWSFAKVGLAALENREADKATSMTLTNLLGAPPAMSYFRSQVNFGGNLARSGLPVGVDFTTNGATFSTTTDLNGRFEVIASQATLAGSGQRVTIQVFDAGRAVSLGTAVLDISGISGQLGGCSKMQSRSIARAAEVSDDGGCTATIPPISATFPGRPFDYDAAYCRQVVSTYSEAIAFEIRSAQDSINGILAAFGAGDPDGAAAIASVQSILAQGIRQLLEDQQFFLRTGGCWEELGAAPSSESVLP